MRLFKVIFFNFFIQRTNKIKKKDTLCKIYSVNSRNKRILKSNTISKIEFFVCAYIFLSFPINLQSLIFFPVVKKNLNTLYQTNLLVVNLI